MHMHVYIHTYIYIYVFVHIYIKTIFSLRNHGCNSIRSKPEVQPARGRGEADRLAASAPRAISASLEADTLPLS